MTQRVFNVRLQGCCTEHEILVDELNFQSAWDKVSGGSMGQKRRPGPNFFFYAVFGEKLGQIVGWSSLGLTSLLGNPGAATESVRLSHDGTRWYRSHVVLH